MAVNIELPTRQYSVYDVIQKGNMISDCKYNS